MWWPFNHSTPLTLGAAALIASIPPNPYPGNVIFYVPDPRGSSTWTNGEPQTLIGSQIPEPSTLLLLGSGLVGFGGWMRRKAA